jgi:hypothetical protein
MMELVLEILSLTDRRLGQTHLFQQLSKALVGAQ